MTRINLVPREEREKELRRRIFMMPAAGAAILALVLGGSYFYYDRALSNTEQEAESYRQNNANIAKQVSELQQYDDLKVQKTARLSSISVTYAQRVRWSRILDDLAFVIPEDVWLTAISAQVPGAQVSAETRPRGGTTPESEGKDMIIEGQTKVMSSVAVFMIRVGLLPSLTDVTLVSAEKEQVGNEEVVNFKIAASLKQGAETQRTTTPSTSGGNLGQSTSPASTSSTTGTGSRTSTGSSNTGTSGQEGTP